MLSFSKLVLVVPLLLFTSYDVPYLRAIALSEALKDVSGSRVDIWFGKKDEYTLFRERFYISYIPKTEDGGGAIKDYVTVPDSTFFISLLVEKNRDGILSRAEVNKIRAKEIPGKVAESMKFARFDSLPENVVLEQDGASSTNILVYEGPIRVDDTLEKLSLVREHWVGRNTGFIYKEILRSSEGIIIDYKMYFPDHKIPGVKITEEQAHSQMLNFAQKMGRTKIFSFQKAKRFLKKWNVADRDIEMLSRSIDLVEKQGQGDACGPASADRDEREGDG